MGQVRQLLSLSCWVGAMLMLLAFGTTTAHAQTMNRLAETGVIRLGMSEFSPPYSYLTINGQPAGLAVQLCILIAEELERSSFPQLKAEFIPVAAERRFSAIDEGLLDMHCGANTITLQRRELVDFSLPFFIDGAGVLLRDPGPRSFEDLAGAKIAVVSGTTTEASLNAALEQAGINATIIGVRNHAAAMELITNNDVTAYYGDRGILQYLMATEPNDGLRLANRYFTYETYGLALPRGDEEFRLLVDRILAEIFRSGQIQSLLSDSFGANAQISDIVKHLYLIAGLPE